MCGHWGDWAPTPDDDRGARWCAACGKRIDTIFIECECLIAADKEAEERELDTIDFPDVRKIQTGDLADVCQIQTREAA